MPPWPVAFACIFAATLGVAVAGTAASLQGPWSFIAPGVPSGMVALTGLLVGAGLVGGAWLAWRGERAGRIMLVWGFVLTALPIAPLGLILPFFVLLALIVSGVFALASPSARAWFDGAEAQRAPRDAQAGTDGG